jgi:PadR family transcriptional regulator, regulatory protein PadR
MPDKSMKAIQREILLSFWKIHILHHAAEGPVVGQWMLKELRHHGYEISPGTLYPILHRMERLGWLRSEVDESAGLKAKRSFYATEAGKEVLSIVLKQLDELKEETQTEYCEGRKGEEK